MRAIPAALPPTTTGSGLAEPSRISTLVAPTAVALMLLLLSVWLDRLRDKEVRESTPPPETRRNHRCPPTSWTRCCRFSASEDGPHPSRWPRHSTLHWSRSGPPCSTS